MYGIFCGGIGFCRVVLVMFHNKFESKIVYSGVTKFFKLDLHYKPF